MRKFILLFLGLILMSSFTLAVLPRPYGQTDYGSWLYGEGQDYTGDTLTKNVHYTIQEGGKNGGTLTLTSAGGNYSNEQVNCTTLKYLADTDNQATADQFKTGILTFGTFTVILVLAFISQIIIREFKKRN